MNRTCEFSLSTDGETTGRKRNKLNKKKAKSRETIESLRNLNTKK